MELSSTCFSTSEMPRTSSWPRVSKKEQPTEASTKTARLVTLHHSAFILTPVVVKVPLIDVEKRMKSKAEIYNFLVTEWQAYLPEYKDCSPGTAQPGNFETLPHSRFILTFRIAFLKDICRGKKLHLKNDERVLLHVPGHYDVRLSSTVTFSIGAVSPLAMAVGKAISPGPGNFSLKSLL